MNQIVDILAKDKHRTVSFRDYNFKDGTGRIEFRVIGNNYFGKLYKKTLESVNRFGMLIATSTDTKTHHKEVVDNLKKVGKISMLTLVDNAIDNKKRLSEKDEENLFDLKQTELLVRYMKFLHTLKIKWGKGIDHIKDDPKASFDYASSIKDRFPEGEEAIGKDAMLSFKYAKDIIKGRFLEGEPAMAKNPNVAFTYATLVIKEPFKEGEHAIFTDDYYADTYKKKFYEGKTK
jgi:hypothetical protein